MGFCLEEKDLWLPNLWSASIYDIDYDALWKRGVRGIVFDRDCTLASAWSHSLPKRSLKLIRKLKAKGFSIVILSNTGPGTGKVQRNAEEAGVDCVCCRKKAEFKPKPWGFERATEKLGLKPDQILIIGDQIKNDIMGGNAAGMFTALVQRMGHDSLLLSLSGYPQYKRLMERPARHYIETNRRHGVWYE